MKISCRSQRVIETVVLVVVFFLLLAGFAPAIFAQTSPPRLVPSFIDWVAGTPGVSGSAPGAGQAAVAARGYGGSGTALISAARWGIADGEGNIYIGDTSNEFIRKVDAADGLIYVVVPPFSSMGQPRGGAIDQFGDLIFGDESKSKVWIWNPVTSAQPVSFGGGANKNSGCNGDGGNATGAQMDNDSAVAVDINGNVYVADNNCNVIRKIDTRGIISTPVGKALMGNGGGASGSCLVNGVCPASSAGQACNAYYAGVNNPYGVAVDPDGNVYVANPATNNHSPTPGCFDVIKVLVDPTTCTSSLPAGQACTAAYGGSISQNSQVVLLAGTGTSSDSSDPGGAATKDPDQNTTKFGLATAINIKPQALGIDPRRNPAGSVNPFNVLIGESSHVWLYDGTTGYMRMIAGGGGAITAGNPPAPKSPPAQETTGVCNVTNPPGWPADHTCASSIGGHCYAWATPPWDIYGDGCIATEATLSNNYGDSMDVEGNVLVGDDGDDLIRKVSTGAQFDARPSPTNPGNVPLTQGLYVHFGVNDGPAANQDGSVASNAFVIPAGTDFSIAATSNSTPLTVNGVSYTSNPLCGVDQTGKGDINPANGSAATTNPDGTLDCYLAVTFTPSRPGKSHAPLTITSALGLVTTVQLTGIVAQPAITVDPATVSILSTSVNNPEGVAVDQDGNWYVADTNNNTVWKFSQGVPTDLADSTNGGLKGPLGVAVDGAQNVYIADTGNNVIKRVDGVTGAVTVFAGGGTPCPLPPLVNTPMQYPYPPAPPDAIGNNCPATQATLSAPSGVAVDFRGDVYIADTGDNEIRRVEAMTGYISLAAGLAPGSTAGDCLSSSPCSPQLAKLNAPAAVATGVWGNFYIADTGNARILQVSADGGELLDSVNCSGLSVPCPVGNLISAVASGVAAEGLAADSAGDLYYADTAADTVALVNLLEPADPTNNPNGNSPESPMAVYDKTTTEYVIGATGVAGSIGNNGDSADNFLLTGPTGVAVDPYGSVYVADSGNNRILLLQRQATGAIGLDFGGINWGLNATSAPIFLGNAGDLSGAFDWPFPLDNQAVVFDPSTLPCTPGSVVNGVTCPSSGQIPTSEVLTASNNDVFTEINAGSGSSSSCGSSLNSGGVCQYTTQFQCPQGSGSGGTGPLYPSEPNACEIFESTYVPAVTATPGATVTIDQYGECGIFPPLTTTTTLTPSSTMTFGDPNASIKVTLTPQGQGSTPQGNVALLIDNVIYSVTQLDNTGSATWGGGASGSVPMPWQQLFKNLAGTKGALQAHSLSVTYYVTAGQLGTCHYGKQSFNNLPQVTFAPSSTASALQLSVSSAPAFQPMTVTATVTTPGSFIPNVGEVLFDFYLAGTSTVAWSASVPVNANGVATLSIPVICVPNPGSAPTPAPTGLCEVNRTTGQAYSVTAQYTAQTPPASDGSVGPVGLVTASTSSASALMITPAPEDFSLTYTFPITGDKTIIVDSPDNQWHNAEMWIKPINYPTNINMNFRCSGAPQWAACLITSNPVVFLPDSEVNFSAAPFPLSYDNVSPVVVTIVPNVAPIGSRRHRLPVWAALVFLFPGLVFAGAGFLAGMRRRKGLRGKVFFLLGLIFLLCLLAGVPGCGGDLKQVNAVTPAGSGNITVTGIMTTLDGTVLQKHSIQIPYVVD
jgi:hypothetical protein